MKTLKDAGPVSDRRAGRWVHYSFNAEALADMEDALKGLRESTATTLLGDDACCD
ncbi:MAG: hypothetical protein WEF86_05295 [Gemmatimonadota bacterium]